MRRTFSASFAKCPLMAFISVRLRAQVFSRLLAMRSASLMEESGTVSTVLLDSPVTMAACGAKPGSLSHSSLLLMR